jgi:hypothetical protein
LQGPNFSTVTFTKGLSNQRALANAAQAARELDTLRTAARQVKPSIYNRNLHLMSASNWRPENVCSKNKTFQAIHVTDCQGITGLG